MTAAAVQQIGAFWCLLVLAYWLNGFDHADDGVEVPLRRLAERECWMQRFDPGLAVAS